MDQSEAFRYRVAGWSPARIARHFGVDVAEVEGAITAESATRVINLDEERTIQYLRLERCAETAMQKVVDGDTRAASVVVRIAERQARLLGLDAATKYLVVDEDENHEAIVQAGVDAFNDLMRKMGEAE